MDHGQNKRDANDLEKWLAKYLGGRRMPASGALDHMKGDVTWNDYLVDSKNTIKSTIVLKSGELRKISREALEAGKTGHIIITFREKGTHWAVVPKADCDFDSYCLPIVTEKNQRISSSMLASVKSKATKARILPSIYITFTGMPLGTPRKWLIIPLELYKEKFENPNE